MEMAKTFAAHGANVAIMGRRKEVLELAGLFVFVYFFYSDAIDELVVVVSIQKEANHGAAVIGVTGDVRDDRSCQEAVAATVKKFGKLDTLINNAAGNFLASLDDLTPKAANLSRFFICTHTHSH